MDFLQRLQRKLQDRVVKCRLSIKKKRLLADILDRAKAKDHERELFKNKFYDQDFVEALRLADEVEKIAQKEISLETEMEQARSMMLRAEILAESWK